jgi:tetratricopeptide (TPR) repeat protein
MVHVGHFRLALKYIKRAQELFTEQNGKPPYKDSLAQQEHAQILYLLSQVKVDLDNYQGALDILDEFYGYGYYGAWYSGSRAWVLMKLGKIDDAIKIARLGILAGAEPGRTLNMLGILLSMKSERDAALSVFKDAVRYEMSLGTQGQPATPLNNSGEVYKEMFSEDNAESAWLRATSLPDGCEHILPTLNLTLLYIDKLNYAGAKKALDNFNSCIAQYPLRNGEEHRALEHLARGRIDLHTGHVDAAVAHFEAALEDRQWFGKIGTSEEDLRAAAMISLAQALTIQNNHLATRQFSSWGDWLESFKTASSNEVRSWWNMRRASQIMTHDLASLEDLYIRNTDSLIEYPTFGEMLSLLPRSTLERKIDLIRKEDNRKEADIFYKAYIAENMVTGYRRQEGLKLLDEVIAACRDRMDDLLKVHALILKLKNTPPGTAEYEANINRVFSLARAEIRNYGLKLPVNYSIDNSSARTQIADSAFLLDNSKDLQYSVNYEFTDGEYKLTFVSSNNAIGNVTVKGKDLEEVVNDLTEAVFSVDLDS